MLFVVCYGLHVGEWLLLRVHLFLDSCVAFLGSCLLYVVSCLKFLDLCY